MDGAIEEAGFSLESGATQTGPRRLPEPRLVRAARAAGGSSALLPGGERRPGPAREAQLPERDARGLTSDPASRAPVRRFAALHRGDTAAFAARASGSANRPNSD